MTPVEFVEKITQVVYDSTVTGCISLMEKPPGKRPSSQLRSLSQWFSQLSEPDRNKVRDAIKLATGQSVFGMLAVLDGVRQIDDSENKGSLELRYLRDGQSQLINDPNAEPLHDIFNEIAPPV